MFNKLLNEKNRYILVNIIFLLIILSSFLLMIALLKDSALNFLIAIFEGVEKNVFLSILLIVYTGTFGGYLIYKLINHKIVINGSLIYLTMSINTIQLFNLEKVQYYFSRIGVENVQFVKKFIFIFCYIILTILTIYSLCVIIKNLWKVVREKIVDFDPPKINSSELLQTIGLYYLDFDYNKNLSYYVTYEANGKVIKEDLTSSKLLCLVGELLPEVEYEIKLYSLGKIKARFIALESKETIKFLLNRKPTDLQERISYYYHYSPQLIECYISLLQVFDKMFKRLLIHSPEVVIMESLTKKTIFAKMYLDKENIVVRFNSNPFLLDEEFNIVNSFEEDCMFPTKYIVRSLEDVEYMKKIVDKIKNIKN